MQLKQLVKIISVIIALILNYFLATYCAKLLDINDVVFKSITGMTPDIKGNIMLFIVLVFFETLITIKIYDKVVKEK